MLLHGQVEVNRRDTSEVWISAFHPSIQVQHASLSVFHADAQVRVLKVVERLCNKLDLPI